MKFFTKSNLRMLAITAFAVFCYVSTIAQTDTVNVRFSNDSLDCATGTYYIDIELQNPTSSAYTANTANFRFTYDQSALGYPFTVNAHSSSPGVTSAGPDSSLLFMGRTIMSAGFFDFGYTVTLPANSGWVGVLTLEFPVVDYAGCPDLVWVACAPPAATGHATRCTKVTEGNNIFDPNDPLFVRDHLVNLGNACLGAFCNLPPDALDPTDPSNTSDSVVVPIGAGDTMTLCIPTVEDPADIIGGDSIVQNISGINGTILSYSDDTCFTYIAPATGTDVFDVIICDEAGGCDTLNFTFEVCAIPTPTIAGGMSGDSACYNDALTGTFTLSVPASADYDSYQWYVDGAPIVGATSISYEANTIGTHTYHVVVWHSSDPACTEASNMVSLTVHPPVVPGPITGQ